eukprot:CAMPEP_0196723196 /NCGR_PEP_ID=MMETSP1091-20130531/5348_1 /TAXON_ID=302021 /ORGANISM="Rhodomonas sp., Strain CCMP768" /LENGTH=44 /DNA_ID= /DNA_START= /DNA_END= /DNA_ORIENTATION=
MAFGTNPASSIVMPSSFNSRRGIALMRRIFPGPPQLLCATALSC